MTHTASKNKKLSLGGMLEGLGEGEFYVTVDGRRVERWWELAETDKFTVCLTVLGGKGGFGSLLRSFRIYRSTNQEMCRDLTGRRLKDAKEEERLKKWIGKKAQREAEKQRKLKEKYERLKAGPGKHEFNDTEYHQQSEELIEKTEDAVEAGLKAAEGSGVVSDMSVASVFGVEELKGEGLRKRKSTSSSTDSHSPIPKKKRKTTPLKAKGLWMTEMAGLSDSEGEVSEGEESDEIGHGEGGECSSSMLNTGGTGGVSVCSITVLPNKNKEQAVPAETTEDLSATTKVMSSSNTSTKQADKSISEIEMTTPETTTKKMDTTIDDISQKTSEKKEKSAEKVEKRPERTDYPELCLSDVETLEEVMELDLDHLKCELQRRSLKCGGTKEERAKRLWGVRGLNPDQYPKNIKAKAK